MIKYLSIEIIYIIQFNKNIRLVSRECANANIRYNTSVDITITLYIIIG